MVGLGCLACENSEAGWAWCARIVKGPGSNLEVVVESRKRLKRLRAFERRAVNRCQGLSGQSPTAVVENFNDPEHPEQKVMDNPTAEAVNSPARF